MVWRYLGLRPDGGITRNLAGVIDQATRCPRHRTEPQPTEIKNRVRGRVRVRVRLGNEKERGGSRAIAEREYRRAGIYFFLSRGPPNRPVLGCLFDFS